MPSKPECHPLHIKRFVVRDDVMTDEVAFCHYTFYASKGAGRAHTCELLSGHKGECSDAES